MAHIAHDVVHAVTHTDKGMLYLIKELMLRPGDVIREYLDGRRKAYYNPFSFLLIVLGIATLIAANFNLVTGNSRKDPISIFLNQHYNLVHIYNIPFMALFAWLFFRKSKRNYAEHLIAAVFTSAERVVFYTILAMPLMIMFPKYYMTITFAYVVIWGVYSCWATTSYTEERNWWGWVKAVMISVIVYGITYGTIFAAYMYYYAVYLPKHH